MARIKDAKLVMVPSSAETHGHFTHLRAAVWKRCLAEFMSMAP
jgi:homoserine O-acetyltransferase